MSACLSTTITLKDVESFEEYGAKATALIAEHGGEVVLMGSVAKLLVGQADHHYEVVVRFPDTATIEAFYGDQHRLLRANKAMPRRLGVSGRGACL